MEKMIMLPVIVMVFSSLSAMAEGDILVYNMDPPRLIEEEFRDVPARFGEPLPPEGMRAQVVRGEPHDGCSAMRPPPTPSLPNFTGNWVVLVARYNCTFEQKVRNAQNAGYNGVIVHNVNSSDLEVMSAKNPVGIDISAVFVSENTGDVINTNYLYNYGFFVVINGDLPNYINPHLLLPMAIVFGLCLFLIITSLVVKCIKNRRRARRYRLPKSLLKKIPTCKFEKGDPYDTCAICLDDYVEGDKLRVLPCAHAYHCKCIDPWLTKNRRVCPVCKRKVFPRGRRGQRSVMASPDTNSDTDTDDDRAPLVPAATGNATQGGTFAVQSENPFVRAGREAGCAASGGSSTSGSPQHQPPDNRTAPFAGSWPEYSGGARGNPFLSGILNLRNEPRTQNESSEDRNKNPFENEEGSEESYKCLSETKHEPRQEVKIERFNRRRSNGSPSSKSSQKSSRDQPASTHRRGSTSTQGSARSSNSDRSNYDGASMVPVESITSDRHSINGGGDSRDENLPFDSQGRIGVAALPNVNVGQMGTENRDYLV